MLMRAISFFCALAALGIFCAARAEELPVAGFKVPDGFVAEHYAMDKDTSSVLCMAFNSKGKLLTAAAGGGPQEIRILEEANGVCSGHRIFYAGLHCQGMCAVGTDIYVIGNGKLFLLKDVDGHAEYQVTLCPELLGSMTEHGPHAVVHGPDGHFYIMLGNDCSFKLSHLDPASPVREQHLYWGNLLPLQSSSGFMDGHGPPGGYILRTDPKGKTWELVAHSFRNAYDLAFAPSGEMFSFDSDMEWDIGLPWYRPVRFVHVPWGANFGWRYGSGKWKNHCADSTPPMIEVGRGSPTGVEVYNHVAFPEEYRDAVFACDWSRARVIVTKPVRNGATWKGESTEFLTARGANFPVTDCCVGPDGALYCSYGGRGAKGGVVRVRYTGASPMKSVFKPVHLLHLPEPIVKALDTPQYQSAFGRAAIAEQKKIVGADWNKQLAAVVRDSERDDGVRGRALDFLGMDGGTIDPSLLVDLSNDKSAFMRAQAALRISTNGDASARAALTMMLGDADAWVLRRACEALARFPDPDAADKLVPLLAHADRYVRYAASAALLRLPAESWQAKVMALPSPLGKTEGLLTWAQSFQSLNIDAQKVAPHFEKMLGAGIELLDAKLTPDETLRALRAVSLTLLARAERPKEEAVENKALAQARALKAVIPAALKDRLVARCSALLAHDDTRVCMDSAEILGFVGDSRSIAHLLEKLKNDLLPRDERIHYANCVSNISEGWTSSSASELLEFLAAPGPGENGYSFAASLTQCASHMARQLTPEQRHAAFNALSTGAKTFAAGAQGFGEMSLKTVVEAFSKSHDIEARRQLLNKIAAANNDEAFREMEKLLDETSPLYDSLLTLLMRFKHADAKKYAVLGLSSTSRGVAAEALARVKELFKEDPEDQNTYYGLIACAARSNEARKDALELLKKWPVDDKALKEMPEKEDDQVAFWEKVYQKNYPNDKRSFPVFSGEGYQDPAKFQKLAEFIKSSSPEKTGNAEAGKTLYTTAKCINCHAFKGAGKQLGPELTDVSKRFEQSKILDDLIYPSKIVDTRYKQVLFATKDGQRISGFVSAETDDALSVTNAEAVTTVLKKSEIARKSITELSIMPSGLVDALTPEQIRDLLAFLETGKN